ncbi:hypothetical protein VAA_04160 [Vibrio anguillarum 775]|nr:hypothetical protein VAA_04160 [Vibrio anguillarum 775]ARV25548.1 hypothetical protein A6A12_2992 [Vibrio anguillarum]
MLSFDALWLLFKQNRCFSYFLLKTACTHLRSPYNAASLTRHSQ